MKRFLVAAVVVLGCAACGGGGASSAPTPQPTLAQHPQTGILKPAANARDTVNRLNQQTNQTDQQTGGSGYTP